MGENNTVIVIGASLGGLGALRTIFSRLPVSFPAPILVVMHVGSHESMLPSILSLSTVLSVRHAENGMTLEAGRILVAPSDQHLLVERHQVRLTHGPKENHARPAIDPLFRSAAIAHGSRVIGVILTGNLDDGVVGLQAIKDYGGTAIVQDPREAEAPCMPQSALAYVDVDYCLPLDGIASKLLELADRSERAAVHIQASERDIMENRFASGDEPIPVIADLDRIGTRSTQTCPECGGTLWEINDSFPVRFRCHTGHSLTGNAMVRVQNRLSEDAIWSAVRALHEKHTLHKRLATDALRRGAADVANEHRAAAEQANQHAQALRKIISS
ncbi:MAG TPA: chemotaxis protein CheB [Noviherbaspirillum sp.]